MIICAVRSSGNTHVKPLKRNLKLWVESKSIEDIFTNLSVIKTQWGVLLLTEDKLKVQEVYIKNYLGFGKPIMLFLNEKLQWNWANF